ncbi:polysaccharide polymerase [Peptacetobacter hiranonis]|uniref:polysaccharide polymerase n=1 Tax=Peptacetobacter hiranonis TaxID=89152 RepID=UPI001916F2E5|nr:polysaccharide polymerase [Peptacetobacter hiranonis]QQQ86115.1 polysaccharide polymerase [Peptacetobacter hiranonis]
MERLNMRENSNLSRAFFSITMVVILLRRYMIFNLEPTAFIEKSSSLLFYASIGLLMIQFLLIRKHNITELAIFLTACVLYVFTREGAILVLILLAIIVRDIDDEYVVKNYLIINALFIIAFVLIGNFLPDLIKISDTHYRLKDGVYVVRNCFGLHNPNLVFFYSIGVYAAYIFLRFDKYNMVDRAILLVMTIFIYKVTMSRTGLLTMIAALFLVEILKYIDLKRYTKISFLVKISPILLLVGSVAIGVLFSKSELLNSVLASRPRYWNIYLTQEGNFLSLFGNVYSAEIKQANPLDNSYVYLTVMLGLVSVVFFMFLLYKGLDIFIKKNENKYIAVIVMFLVYSFAENILFEAGFNFGIVFLIKYIILDDTLKNKVKFRRRKDASVANNAYVK